jgi:hypothetical protein
VFLRLSGAYRKPTHTSTHVLDDANWHLSTLALVICLAIRLHASCRYFLPGEYFVLALNRKAWTFGESFGDETTSFCATLFLGLLRRLNLGDYPRVDDLQSRMNEWCGRDRHPIAPVRVCGLVMQDGEHVFERCLAGGGNVSPNCRVRWLVPPALRPAPGRRPPCPPAISLKPR